MNKATGLAILVSFLAWAAHAQESSTKGSMSNGPLSGSWGSLAPYVGFNAGYTGYTSHVDVEGVPAQAKIIGSYLSPDTSHVFDLGLGFESQIFSQTAAMDRNLQSPLLEAAYRYQMANGLQAGVVWNTLFNKGANYGANQADAQFVGLQALKEFPLSQDWMMRVGGRYMTDVNVTGTWMNIVMADIEFGWNPQRPASVQSAAYQPNSHKRGLAGVGGSSSGSEVIDTAGVGASGPIHSTTREQVDPRPLSGTDYSARKDLLLFNLNSAALPAQDRTKLEKLAAALKNEQRSIDQVEVIGYADPSGTEAYNKKLSRQRAEAVEKALAAKGLSASKMKVIARGEQDPIAGSEEKSRRVELRFHSAKDQGKIAEIVKSIE